MRDILMVMFENEIVFFDDKTKRQVFVVAKNEYGDENIQVRWNDFFTTDVENYLNDHRGEHITYKILEKLDDLRKGKEMRVQLREDTSTKQRFITDESGCNIMVLEKRGGVDDGKVVKKFETDELTQLFFRGWKKIDDDDRYKHAYLVVRALDLDELKWKLGK